VIRTTRRLAAAGFAVLLLAGCGGAQTRAGAAATVGDERIAADLLEQVVERGLQDPQAQQQFGTNRVDYQRQVLNRLVRAELLEAVAQERDITVTQGDVDEQLAQFAEQAGGREQLEMQAAAGGIHPDDLPRFAREVVLETELSDALTEEVDVPDEQLQALYEQNLGMFDQVRTRHILVEDEAQARDLLAQVQADRSRFAALAAEFSIDESNADNGGDLGVAGRGQFVEEFESAVFGAQPGDVVLVQTQFGWHVVEVLERQTTTLEEARDELRRQALGEQGQQLVVEALSDAAERLGVEVNPRFGRWDADAVEVVPVPEDDGLSKPAPEGSEPAVQQGQPGQPVPEDQPAPEGEPVPAPQ
jgi:foldase protein PrsA